MRQSGRYHSGLSPQAQKKTSQSKISIWNRSNSIKINWTDWSNQSKSIETNQPKKYWKEGQMQRMAISFNISILYTTWTPQCTHCKVMLDVDIQWTWNHIYNCTAGLWSWRMSSVVKLNVSKKDFPSEKLFHRSNHD